MIPELFERIETYRALSSLTRLRGCVRHRVLQRKATIGMSAQATPRYIRRASETFKTLSPSNRLHARLSLFRPTAPQERGKNEAVHK